MQQVSQRIQSAYLSVALLMLLIVIAIYACQLVHTFLPALFRCTVDWLLSFFIFLTNLSLLSYFLKAYKLIVDFLF